MAALVHMIHLLVMALSITLGVLLGFIAAVLLFVAGMLVIFRRGVVKLYRQFTAEFERYRNV